MSNNITDFLKYELYPAVYDRADEVFTEHSFKRYAGGWRSKTYLDGSPHKSRADKTVISKKALGCILEQGGDSKSLVDYVADRDGVDFIQAVRTLARAVGLRVPSGEVSTEYRQRASILEDANSYFIYCLESSPQAEEVRSYIASRGYSPEEAKDMELGFIPSKEKLYKYLKETRKHSGESIEKALQLTSKGIGETHRLTIPYRSGGALRGFKFRRTTDDQPKYLNSTTEGLRTDGFFNLLAAKGDKDIVIVEGELDSLTATAKGVPNVVAAGGSSIAPEQIRDAIRLGAKSFTLCFDTEPKKDQSKEILAAIEVIRGEGVDRVYIAQLPDLNGVKTDTDSLIRDKGVEAFNKVLASRLSYGAYLGSTMYTEFTSKLTDGEIDYKDRDLLRVKAVELRYGMSPADRDDFNRVLIEPLRSLGFEEIILTQLEEDLKEKRAEADRVKATSKLIADLQRPDNRGKEDKIVEDWLKTSNIKTGATLEPPPTSFTQLLTDIADLPEAYSTGYAKLDKLVGFTPASINLIAGRPSHGKTTLLFNFLIEMSRRYPKESFYFFSYEEPKANITVKLLNRLTAIDLSPYYRGMDLTKPTNYEFIKAYIRHRRTDITQLEDAKIELAELVDSGRIVLIDKSYTVEDLRAYLSYLNAKKKVGAVLIDYIQKLRTRKQSPDMRLEIANISNTLLNTAKDTGLPLILGAQLNRAAATGGGDKQPKLENLKEAGNLEEDANTVISVYNEARELDKTEDGTEYKKLKEVKLELKVLKNREGEPNAKADLWLEKYTGVVREEPILEGRGGSSSLTSALT